MDFYARLLREFGADVGVEGLAFNEDGVCAFVVDNSVYCALAYMDNDDSLTMLCELPGERAEMSSEAHLARLAETSLNSLAGEAPSIGWDDSEGKWIAFRRLPRRSFTAEMLAETFSEFVIWTVLESSNLTCLGISQRRRDVPVLSKNVIRMT